LADGTVDAVSFSEIRSMPGNLLVGWCLAVSLLAVGLGVAQAGVISKVTLVPETAQRGKASPQIEEQLDKAIDCFKRRDYDQALDILKKARNGHATLPPARLMLARLFLASNQETLGRAALEQAAVENPDYPGTHLAFSTLAIGEGRLATASLHLERAAVLAESQRWTDNEKRFFFVQCYAGKAAVAESRSDWPAAVAALANILDMEPKNGKARQQMARAFFNLGRQNEASKEMERSVKDDPSLPPPAISMGWLFTQKGDIDKAAKLMESAVHSAPTDPRAHQGVAEWLLQQGRGEQAKAHAEIAAELDPDSKEVRLLRGLIARQFKDYPQAEIHFQALHQKSPGDFSASNQLALTLIEQQDKLKQESALQLAEANGRLHPGSVEALSTLGWVYYRLGRLNDAEQILQSVASGRPLEANTAYYLARVMFDRGKRDTAVQLFQASIDASANFMYRTEARDWLARITVEPP
jgi:tetratricopeptide (TPR) repeat protein